MNNPDVCIIDYGSGNVRSVYNIFKAIHDNIRISNDPADIDEATHIVLPGVGAYGAAMDKLKNLGIIDLLHKNVLEKKKPFLGICVGMQILSDEGFEHGTHKGLGWIHGKVKKMETGDLPLPHVGWNNIIVSGNTSSLCAAFNDVDYYFVHSYYFEPDDLSAVDAVFVYGGEYTAAINRENIYGVQFHPEKSQKAGKLILKKFLSL